MSDPSSPPFPPSSRPPSFPDEELLRKARALREILVDRGLTLAAAESLTGGLLSATFTSIPGSSKFFLAGFIAYSNRSKNVFLEVPDAILETRGAVSPECSLLMAENARRLAGSDLSVSTTGIAGPDGGTPTKPVGLVYVSVSGEKGHFTEKHLFDGIRGEIVMSSVVAALDSLARFLSEG
ncbi:MAG: CinA family protein [Deltaproteobacteria bacterium]|jgi:PncC family amidohydrolase|nr:CinA family protein [Deltaproteobacteria bacterium]